MGIKTIHGDFVQGDVSGKEDYSRTHVDFVGRW